MTRTSQKQREDIFDLPQPPTPGTGSPIPGPEGLDLSGGCLGGMVTSRIEPCINQQCSYESTEGYRMSCMVSADSPGARFSKGQEIFLARRQI